MKPFDELPFTNKFGQQIFPGDKIVVVTGGRGSTINTYKGVYLGLRLNKDWRDKEQIETVVEVEDRFFGYFDSVTGEKTKWGADRAVGRWYEAPRKTTIWSGRIFKLA